MKLWVMTLLRYDKYGNATILKSFVKHAPDSQVGVHKKKLKTKMDIKDQGETKLW